MVNISERVIILYNENVRVYITRHQKCIRYRHHHKIFIIYKTHLLTLSHISTNLVHALILQKLKTDLTIKSCF